MIVNLFIRARWRKLLITWLNLGFGDAYAVRWPAEHATRIADVDAHQRRFGFWQAERVAKAQPASPERILLIGMGFSQAPALKDDP